METKRSTIFSEAEKVLLTELVETNLSVVNSKFKSGINNQLKKRVWVDIAAELNARGGAQRTPQQIKDKWRKSCGTAREEAAKERAYAKTTGGGPPSTTYKDPTTEKILQLHQRAPNFFGIDGGIEMGLSVNMIDSNLGLDGKNS